VLKIVGDRPFLFTNPRANVVLPELCAWVWHKMVEAGRKAYPLWRKNRVRSIPATSLASHHLNRTGARKFYCRPVAGPATRIGELSK